METSENMEINSNNVFRLFKFFETWHIHRASTCSIGWFVSLLAREEVLLAGVCEKKILFRLKIYDRLRQATAKRTGCK